MGGRVDWVMLRAAAQFLRAQGCEDAAKAVEDARERLMRPSPLDWSLRSEDGAWRIVSFNEITSEAQIVRVG